VTHVTRQGRGKGGPERERHLEKHGAYAPNSTSPRATNQAAFVREKEGKKEGKEKKVATETLVLNAQGPSGPLGVV